MPNVPDEKTVAAMIRDAVALQRKHNAIAVIVVHEGGAAWGHRHDAQGEDVRAEIIAAGNEIRNYLNKQGGR